MLDRAVLSRSVHRLKHEQYRPTVLRIKHVLKLGQEIDALGEGFLGAGLVFGRKFQRVVGVDVLQAKTVMVMRKGLASLRAFLIRFFISLLFMISPRFSLLLTLVLLTPYVRGKESGVRGSRLKFSIG